jgi:hypothetical protein
MKTDFRFLIYATTPLGIARNIKTEDYQALKLSNLNSDFPPQEMAPERKAALWLNTEPIWAI